MKKYIKFFLTLSGVLLFLSCGGSSNLGKENKGLRSSLDGTWSLDKVSYESEGYFKSVLFEDADSKCFNGSEWFFRSNNSTGTYTLYDADCNPGIRYIRWSIQNDANGNPSTFTFKFTDEKKKDLYGGVGYAFNIRSITANSMVLGSMENAGGDSVGMVFEFSKKSM
jgi:hypothetical protein